MGKGKKTGKILFSIAAFAIGYNNPAMFGISSSAGYSFAAGMYGMSLASTIWSVAAGTQNSNSSDYSNDDYSRFSTTTNEINNDGVIPVIYGTRKWGGLQVWHNPYNGERNLQQDIIICESGIEGVYDCKANDDLIKNDTNISIYNIQYPDATVKYRSASDGDGYLVLYAGGITQEYFLQDVDANNSQTALLTTVIEKIRSDAGNGWKIDGAVDDRTSKGINAKSIQFKTTTPVPCYDDQYVTYGSAGNRVVLDNRGYSLGTYTFHQDELPSNYMDVGSYAKTAWCRTDLIASSRLSSSSPTINQIVKGMKCKVWHSESSLWVTEYTENPAWIIRDFLTNARYGTGKWITEDMLDDDTFKDVAVYCDEEIEYLDAEGNAKTCPRYQLNIILDTQKEPIEHLSSMLAVFGGFLVINEKIGLKVERAEEISYSFDDSTIVKESMSITQTSLEETPNRYRIGYFDPQLNWTEIKVVVEDLEAQLDQDGQIIEKTITLAGCTSQNQALRLGRLYRDLNKTCSITIAFSVATQGMGLECGDVINVSYGNIFANMPFRITEIDETNSGVYQLTCRQYNATIYNDDLGATIVQPSYTVISSPYTKKPPYVENLILTDSSYANTDGTVSVNIDATWQDCNYAYFNCYSVSISNNGWNYKAIGNVYDNKISVNALQPDTTYYVSVQVLSNDGIVSLPTISTITTQSISAINKTMLPPSDLSAFSVTYLNGRFIFSWKVSDPKETIAGFEIRKGTTWSSGQVVVKAVGEDTISANAQAILGTTTFFIKPYNAGGYSTNALTDNITIDVLPSVQTLYSYTGFDKLCSIDGNGVIAEGYTIQKSSITWADIKNKTWGELKNSTIISSAVGNAVLLSPVITLDTLSQASIIINEDWIAPADNPNIYKISTSTDGVTFSDFKLLGSGNIPMKAFQLQITLAGVDIPARLKKIDIDVVATQNTLNYPNQTIPVGGLELTYSQSFSNIPSVIVSPNATVALTIKKENITTTSCKISLLNSSNVDVGGQADIFIVGI